MTTSSGQRAFATVLIGVCIASVRVACNPSPTRLAEALGVTQPIKTVPAEAGEW
jgi:hypothetical protein